MFFKWCQKLQNLHKIKYYLKVGLTYNWSENKSISILFNPISDVHWIWVHIGQSEFTWALISLGMFWVNWYFQVDVKLQINTEIKSIFSF